jgi:hypothetical protein
VAANRHDQARIVIVTLRVTLRHAGQQPSRQATGNHLGDIVATSAAVQPEDIDAGTSPRHRPKENTMPSRLPEWLTRHRRASEFVIAAAVLIGLGITGATAASAAGASSHPASHSAGHASASTSDPDNIQSGDQTSPDSPLTARIAAHQSVHKALVVQRSSVHKAAGPDTDNIQSGDQTTPDTTADGEQSDGPDTDNIQSGPQSGDQSGGQSGPETPDSGGNR